MIKIISAANMHPTNRSRDEFFQYWRERHGPLFAHTPALRRYVQHFSLPEAYGSTASPTHDGASMFWFDDVEALRAADSPLLSEAITPADGVIYEHYVAPRRYGAPE